MRWLFLLCFLAGCGNNSPFLESGTYTLTGTYTRDDWPGGEVGATFGSETTIKAHYGDEPQWDVYVMELPSGTKVKGHPVENEDGSYDIFFFKGEFHKQCGVIDSWFDSVLTPTSSTSFVGGSNSGISLCNISAEGECSCGELWFSVDIQGTKK